MNYTILNDYVTVVVSDHGAELQSIQNNVRQEYLWQGNPEAWGRRAPILFPYVGKLKNDTLRINQRSNDGFSQHGFARDSNFEVLETDQESISMRLTSKMIDHQFPYEFILKVTYTLVENTIQINYEVENIGLNVMYFSLGSHPAFKCPFHNTLGFEDYVLKFDQRENLSTIRLVDGLRANREPFLQGRDSINLSREVFSKDALIFDEIQSGSITLETRSGEQVIRVKNLSAWPFLGIWSKTDSIAEFVCIEPWQGIADSIQGENFDSKLGIIELYPATIWKNDLTIEIF